MEHHQVTRLLDELARLAAATEDGPRLPVLRAVVLSLEELASAPLGDADDEPAAVLHRRFGRAHRLLLRREPVGIGEQLELLLDTLQPRRAPATHVIHSARPAVAETIGYGPAERDAEMSRTG